VTDYGAVQWVREGEDEDGEPLGPLMIRRPDGSRERWHWWVRRSVARAYAEAYGYEIIYDD
jgi:hypothetical protein